MYPTRLFYLLKLCYHHGMKDLLFRPIEVGTYVAYEMRNTMKVGIVTKLNKKQLSVERLPKTGHKTRADFVYPAQAVLLDEEAVVSWLLQGGKSPPV